MKKNQKNVFDSNCVLFHMVNFYQAKNKWEKQSTRDEQNDIKQKDIKKAAITYSKASALKHWQLRLKIGDPKGI